MKKPPIWILALVFLATSIPTVLLLQALNLAGDWRMLTAMAVGVLATAIVQSRLTARQAARGEQE